MSTRAPAPRNAWSIGAGFLLGASVAGAAWLLWPKSHPPALPVRLATASEQREASTHPAAPPETAEAKVLAPTATHDEHLPATAPTAGQRVAPIPGATVAKDFPDDAFDPEAQGAAPELGLPLTLDREKLTALIKGMDDIRRAYQRFAYVEYWYQQIQTLVLTDGVKQALFQRVATGKGFKHPDLPVEWSKYAQAGTSHDLVAVFSGEYMANRLERIKSQVLTGTVRSGDVQFVERGTAFLSRREARGREFLAAAQKMYGWLCDDGILERDEELALPPDEMCDALAAVLADARDALQFLDLDWVLHGYELNRDEQVFQNYLCIAPMVASLNRSIQLLRDPKLSPIDRLSRATAPQANVQLRETVSLYEFIDRLAKSRPWADNQTVRLRRWSLRRQPSEECVLHSMAYQAMNAIDGRALSDAQVEQAYKDSDPANLYPNRPTLGNDYTARPFATRHLRRIAVKDLLSRQNLYGDPEHHLSSNANAVGAKQK